MLYILQGILPITIDTAAYNVLSDESHGYVFLPLGSHFQAIKIYKSKVVIVTSFLYGLSLTSSVHRLRRAAPKHFNIVVVRYAQRIIVHNVVNKLHPLGTIRHKP